MKVIDLLRNAQAEGRTLFAFELLPPLKGEGPEGIFAAIDPLVEFSPSYINFTYHREEVDYVPRPDGLHERRVVRRRPGTVGISAAVARRYGVEVVPHLICGGWSRYDLEDALIDLDFLGVENILALRGDRLRGEHSFRPAADGYAYAHELVAQVGRMNRGQFLDARAADCHRTDFSVGVAAYPEKHSEAPNADSDLKHLKRKVDAGADYIVTQMCFDTSKIIDFAARCRAAGIDVPIVPGLKPLTSKKQLSLLPEVFRVDLPTELVEAVEECRDAEAVRSVGVEWAVEQGRKLKEAGFPALHFYTMGRGDEMTRIARALF